MKLSEVNFSLLRVIVVLMPCYALGMTIDPAYASFTESTLGSLAPGKIADFVVLSQDIMSIPANQILHTKVIATVIDGRPIYGGI
jgi:predicted amidohydrolase YtcJ